MRGLLFSLLITATVFAQGVPTAIKQPVTDEYHGVKVVDDYRWLEDGTSAQTEKWLAAENAYSLHYFEHAPAWNLLLQDIRNPKEKPGATEHSLDFRGGRFFYLQLDRTAQQQSLLMTSDTLGTSSSAPAGARVLLDPTMLDPTGHTSID
jgi:prolyl oligopeptidase